MLQKNNNKLLNEKDFLKLSSVKSGQRVKLENINAGIHLKTKLASLNIKLGTEIEVVKTNNRGAFIVALKNDRLILGHGIVNKLEVSLI